MVVIASGQGGGGVEGNAGAWCNTGLFRDGKHV